MRYLITGHTGFKGAWLSTILSFQGHEVVGISLPAIDRSLYLEASLNDLFVKEYFIDIRDREKLVSAVKEAKADVAIHLAAQPLVRESYKIPIETYETNVIGTLNFLDGVQQTDIGAALVITTDKVYKNENLLRGYIESDTLGGHDPYSSSKAAADIATQSWIASFGSKNVSVARAGNVIGGGDWAIDRLMPELVNAFILNRPARIRYPNSIRPWQHVADCLSGYISLTDKMIKRGYVGEWNFGPRINLENRVSHVADLVCAHWGDNATWEIDSSPQPHEAGYLLLDSTKARTNLNWRDKLDFESTLSWTVDFYKAVSKGESPRKLLQRQVEAFLSL